VIEKYILIIKHFLDIPDTGIVCDVLWSDPQTFESATGWAPNPRGLSYLFGADVVNQFCDTNHIDLIVRAHQVCLNECVFVCFLILNWKSFQFVQDGYKYYANRRLVTVFSAPCYCGECNNAAAIMLVSANLVCSFKVMTLIANECEAQLASDDAPSLTLMCVVIYL
jgi:serine/threonine-protein phosphatase PP1 catalytic subunit